MESNKYIVIWTSYIDVLFILVKKTLKGGNETFRTERNKFETSGDRKVAGFSFRLEYYQGKSFSNIEKSAPARDLLFVLNEDGRIKSLSNELVIIFQHSKDFVLTISSKNPDNI